MDELTPVLLPPHQIDHFYLGGDRIGALRGGPGGPRRPEEWIASVTTRAGEPGVGPSVLPDGSLLADRLAADPEGWLGKDHVDRFGSGLELLVKLLDAGQRLPVHVHPDRGFARRHLGLAHGKTEAWVVVDAEPGAVVGLGLKTALTQRELLDLVRSHDSAAILSTVHTRPARPGDGILVPAGTPHFIGAGVLVVEVQEPTDLSIVLEWEDLALDGDADGHLGLGFETALQAVDLTVWSASDVDRMVRALPPRHPGAPGLTTALPGRTAALPGLTSALPDAADPYFRASWVDARDGVVVEAGLGVLVVLDGTGTLTTDAGRLLLRRGDVALVPHASGAWTLHGPLRGVLCRPPAPDAPTPQR